VLDRSEPRMLARSPCALRLVCWPMFHHGSSTMFRSLEAGVRDHGVPRLPVRTLQRSRSWSARPFRARAASTISVAPKLECSTDLSPSCQLDLFHALELERWTIPSQGCQRDLPVLWTLECWVTWATAVSAISLSLWKLKCTTILSHGCQLDLPVAQKAGALAPVEPRLPVRSLCRSGSWRVRPF